MMGFPGLATLGAYLLLLSIVAPAVLRRAKWVIRAPRLAIALWEALFAGWLLSVGLIALTLAGPLLEHLAWPAEQPTVTAAHVVGAVAGAATALSVVGRAGYMFARELARCGRERRSHALGLALAGEPSDRFHATILDHPAPAVYCVPGLDRGVVVSTAVLGLLSDSELAAVVAHEQGHLRHHHHRVTTIAGALALAFPSVPLLSVGRHEIQILAEMAADDHARRYHDPHALATALVTLARARAPEFALGASGQDVTARLERMLRPSRSLRAPARAAPAATAACAVTLPIGLACSTVFAAATALVGRLLT